MDGVEVLVEWAELAADEVGVSEDFAVVGVSSAM